MIQIKREGVAICPPSHLFGLINAVEQYSKFLTWCQKVIVSHRNQNSIEATVFIHKYGIQFTCPFTYKLKSKNEILVGLPAGGPFSKVAGIWQFSGSTDKTQFSFELQLEYQDSWWMRFFLIPILKFEVKNVIKSFEHRASATYRRA